MNRQEIAMHARIELARRCFWDYCRLRAGDFYKPDRPHLVRLCNELQGFSESNEKVMIVCEPPRHGKSRTAGLFTEWLFGRDNTVKVMTGSYNENLSSTFSKGVRNGISEQKADPDVIVYSDIFPETRIKYGDGATNRWALEGNHSSYLATSPKGTATGFGATWLIIDDLIKLAEEAFNENVLETHWKWFTDTMLSRLEEGGKILIIMTRWASGDLAGRAMEHFTGADEKVRMLVEKALQDDGTMLCPEILSRESYEMKVRPMSPEIASANYQQIPIDLQGRLYQSFKTYATLPCKPDGKPIPLQIRNYTDTADQGEDYLCSITYADYNNEALVLDVYFTKAGMEVTEEETARRLAETGCQVARIESNNGGRGFARNVERILREKYR